MQDTPIVNGYMDGDLESPSGMPSDVDLFMTQHAVADKYVCLLRVYSYETNQYEQVKKYTGNYPDPDDVGKQFGPGKYALMFSWQGEDGPTGRRKPFAKEFKFTLSESYREPHEDYIQDQNEARQKRDKSRLESRKTEAQLRAIENGAGTGNAMVTTDPMEAAERLMEKQLATAAKLAQLGGGRGPDPMATLLPIILKQQENSMTMMMGMFTAVMQSMGAKNNQGPGDGMMEMMKGFTGLLGNVVTMKRELDGDDDEEKESVGEKIFNTFVKFVPIILDKFAQSAEARSRDPLLKMAKGSPEYQAMAKDPAVLAAAVNRLDKKFSPLQTDKILDVMGLKRPEATKENYERFKEPDDAAESDPDDE